MQSSEAPDPGSCSTDDEPALTTRGKMGDRIRSAREQRGLSPKQFAHAVEISDSFLWRIEHGVSEPGKALTVRIADRLGMTLDWLMLGRGPVMAAEPGVNNLPATFGLRVGTIVGDQLRRLRTDAGLTQTEVAVRGGVQRATVSRIERGWQTPDLVTCARLVRACDGKIVDVLAALDSAFGIGVDDLEPTKLPAEVLVNEREVAVVIGPGRRSTAVHGGGAGELDGTDSPAACATMLQFALRDSLSFEFVRTRWMAALVAAEAEETELEQAGGHRPSARAQKS